MKKVILAGAIALCGVVSAQSMGNFKLGAHIGLPVGDAADGYNLNLGVDAAYMWPVAAEFNLGIASGYSAWLGKTVNYPILGDVKFDTLGLVPIAVSGQYKISPQFSLGVDLGYGILFGGGESDGGFYYQPKAAYHFGPSEVNLGYVGVSKDGATLSSINLGYAYSFGN